MKCLPKYFYFKFHRNFFQRKSKLEKIYLWFQVRRSPLKVSNYSEWMLVYELVSFTDWLVALFSFFPSLFSAVCSPTDNNIWRTHRPRVSNVSTLHNVHETPHECMDALRYEWFVYCFCMLYFPDMAHWCDGSSDPLHFNNKIIR